MSKRFSKSPFKLKAAKPNDKSSSAAEVSLGTQVKRVKATKNMVQCSCVVMAHEVEIFSCSKMLKKDVAFKVVELKTPTKTEIKTTDAEIKSESSATEIKTRERRSYYYCGPWHRILH